MSEKQLLTPERIKTYLARRREDLSRMKSALEQKNYSEISAIVHKIKGNARMFDFADLEAIAIKIESLISEKDFSPINAAIADFEKALNSH